MKQILQNLRNGELVVTDVPCAQVGRGQVLIRTQRSLISAGTERMLVEFSQGNLIQKARSQPEKVKQVLDKMRTDGLMPTLEAVFRKLDEPMPLGYCNAGIVGEVGEGVHDLQPGDPVASNGPHAEMVCVPRNLCAMIPDGVSDEQAAFTVLGGVALQGVRLAMPTLGERFVVFGMGLLGLLTVQLLQANGCVVLAVDLNPDRLKLAEGFGAQTVDLSAGGDVVTAGQAWTNGRGVDGALITASAKNDKIIHEAAQACRKRGRIVLVGVVDTNLRRSDFYEKELTFQVSCSYGPGRYDEAYEQAGRDYPLGFVRWTEQRNFEAVLDAMAAGRLNVDKLISHRFPLEQAVSAYDTIRNEPEALGVLLEYPAEVKREPAVVVTPRPTTGSEKVVAGVIGAGNYAKATLLPALSKTGASLAYIADLNGAAAQHAASRFGIGKAVTDYRLILDDPAVNTVFIVVGHDLHARFACEALVAGKHVFVEKPLCLTTKEIAEIHSAYQSAIGNRQSAMLLVGYNRRFSPHTVRMEKLLRGRAEPLCMTMTVNPGAIPSGHWTQDPERGGGRIVGEGCHFIDLLAHLAGSPVVTVSAARVGSGAVRDDKMAIVLAFADGSVGTVNYFANGFKGYPKELLEVFSDGRVLRMENFRVTRAYGFKGFRTFKTPRQDKGHAAELAAFVDRVREGGAPLIPFEELANSTLASFAAVTSAWEGRVVELRMP